MTRIKKEKLVKEQNKKKLMKNWEIKDFSLIFHTILK